MVKRKKIIFLGAPGIGKGTLAKKLANESGMKHISTGDIFRHHINNKTKIGQKVESILNSGGYVSDELTNEIIYETLNNSEVANAGFLLDGYPRTINQAQFLIDNHFDIDYVILLSAPQSFIISRLMNRGRADDNEEIIKKRLEVYEEQTKPLVDFYKKMNLLVEIDASGSIEENYLLLEEQLKNDCN